MGRGSDEVLSDLLSLQTKIHRLFVEPGTAREPRAAVAATWCPAVDIYETEEALVLAAEVPGVDRDEIRVEVSGDLLVLRGERAIHTSDAELSYYRVERPKGGFRRSFRLPAGVRSDEVRATYRDGVLEVLLPKVGASRVPVEIEG